MGSGYHFEVVAPADVASVRAEWLDLTPRDAVTPFALPAFFDAWRTTFEATRTGFIVVGRRGRAIELVLPMWHPRGDRGDWRSLGTFRADYTEAAAASNERALGDAFWRWLAVHAPCRTAKLARMPATSLLARTAGAASSHSIVALAAALRFGRIRSLELGLQREHPYASADQILTGAERLRARHGRRNTAMLERYGAVAYRVLHGGRQLVELLETLFALHVANFAGTGRASQFADPTEQAFYRALATHPELAEIVCMHVLMAGTRVAALHFGFERMGRVYWYKPAFDLELGKCSPGKTLLSHVFADAAARHLERIDLLKGLEPYKAEWADRNQLTATVTIVERTLRDSWRAVARRLPGLASWS